MDYLMVDKGITWLVCVPIGCIRFVGHQHLLDSGYRPRPIRLLSDSTYTTNWHTNWPGNVYLPISLLYCIICHILAIFVISLLNLTLCQKKVKHMYMYSTSWFWICHLGAIPRSRNHAQIAINTIFAYHDSSIEEVCPYETLPWPHEQWSIVNSHKLSIKHDIWNIHDATNIQWNIMTVLLLLYVYSTKSIIKNAFKFITLY